MSSESGDVQEQEHIRLRSAETGQPQDQLVEVELRDDAWLLASERSAEEVDRALEGRLQAIQANFLVDVKDSTLAKAYGVERPIGGDQARLFAYVELVGEYRQVRQDHYDASEQARADYEAKKAEIMGSGRTKGKAKRQRRVSNLWKQQYEPQIQTLSLAVRRAERVQELIMAKAVVDIFSLGNDEADDSFSSSALARLPSLVNEGQDLIANTSKHEGYEAGPIDYFLENLTQFMAGTRDRGLFTRYHYRETPGLVATARDCEVLGTVISFPTAGEEPEAAGQNDRQFADLKRGYFTFLKNRAAYFSHHDFGEAYPQVSLAYDMATAALFQGKTLAVQSVTTELGAIFREASPEEEAARLVSRYYDTVRKPVVDLFLEAGRYPPELAKLYIQQKKSLDLVDQARATDERRIIEGFTALSKLKGDHPLVAMARSKILVQANKKIMHFAKQGRRAHSEESGADGYAEDAMAMEPVRVVMERFGIEADLHVLASAAGANLITVETVAEAKGHFPVNEELLRLQGEEAPERIKHLRRFLRGARRDGVFESREATLQEELFRRYLRLFWQEDAETVDLAARENEALWKQINDFNTWFVSPRGDRFSQHGDPELASRMIQSVTFRIDPDFPREHQAEIWIAGLDDPLTLWLDTQGNMLGYSRQKFMADVAQRDVFANLLLRRLYFITSGLLAQDQEVRGPGEEPAPRRLEFRRAHYMVLQSTPNRVITMQSDTARTHAQEILEDYGIDIYREMLRRRKVGSLLPNQYLTFAREVDKSIKGIAILPNELRYDPNLMPDFI